MATFNILKSLKEDNEVSDANNAVTNDVLSLDDKQSLTHTQVSDHLKNVDKKAEEVDTVAFGLETDEGDIVKVYVALADADAFEKALGKKLGEEDDIETLLDTLADDFDIVDVVWPEEEDVEPSKDFASEFDDDKDLAKDIVQDKDDEKEPSADDKDVHAENLTKNLTKKSDDAGSVVGYTRESLLQATNNSLSESMEVINLGDADLNRLYVEAPTRYQKLIVSTLAALGMPGFLIKQRHSLFKKNLRSAAEAIMSNAHLRIWLKKFIDAKTNSLSTSDEIEESIGEFDPILDKQLTNKYAHTALKIIMSLGVSEDIIKVRRTAVKKSVYDATLHMLRKPRMKVAFKMIADALGIKIDNASEEFEVETDGINSSHKHVRASDVQEEHMSISEEDANDSILGTSPASKLLYQLFIGLGLPDANLRYQNAAVKSAIAEKFKTLKDSRLIISKIKAVLSALDPEQTTQTAESISLKNELSSAITEKEELSKASLIGKQFASDDKDPVDLGEWNVSVLTDQVSLTNTGDFILQLDGSDVDRLVRGFHNKSIVSFVEGAHKVTFRPYGKEYAVKVSGMNKYPNGVVFSKKSIDTFLEMVEQSE